MSATREAYVSMEINRLRSIAFNSMSAFERVGLFECLVESRQ